MIYDSTPYYYIKIYLYKTIKIYVLHSPSYARRFVIYDGFPIFEQIDYLWQTLMIRTDAANSTVRNSAHSILSVSQ